MPIEAFNWNVFLALGTIIGFFVTLYKFFVKPVEKLTTEIALLNNNLQVMQRDHNSLDDKVKIHSKQLTIHDKKLDSHEHRLAHLEKTHFVKDRT